MCRSIDFHEGKSPASRYEIKTVGKLTLFSGRLGLVFGGEDSENILPAAERCFVASRCHSYCTDCNLQSDCQGSLYWR